MASSPRLTVLNPIRVSIVAVAALGVLVASWTAVSWRSLDEGNHALLAAQVDLMIRTQRNQLNTGNIRAAVEALGQGFNDLQIRVTNGSSTIEIGPISPRRTCYSTSIVAGEFNGQLEACRPLDLHLALAGLAIAIYVGLSTLVIGTVFRMEAGARNAIVRLVDESGVSIDRRMSLSEIASNINAIVTDLGSARHREMELASEAAIGRMTQMLAHDVRKPFSILRMGLNMLGNAKDPEGVKRVLSRLVPEVDKAVNNVDGLIADVMEIGANSTQLILEKAAPEALIESAIGDVCRVYPKSSLSFEYHFAHTSMVSVHANKVARVFSNILGNAVQAMSYHGTIWIKTKETDAGFVEFCLGNSGSVIPAEHLPKLFDAFFTSGKKGGTGLGLAIAQKVVTAHGGKIWCESSVTPDHPHGKVEFYFTLPRTSAAVGAYCGKLPATSAEVVQAFSVMSVMNGEPPSVSKAEVELEADVVAAQRELERPIRVLIVDDEEVYRQGLHGSLTKSDALKDAVAIDFADGSVAALASVARGQYDLIITDVDLGPMSANGFDLVRDVRGTASACLICVHSNRMVAEDHKTAIANGADAFLPKPMAREHLLKLVLQATERALAETDKPEPAPTPVAGRPEVAVVEDNPFMLEAWVESLAKDSMVHAADSPEALAAKLEMDPSLLDRLACVITDYNFDNSPQNGVDLGRMIKHRRPGLRVLLSSDGTIPEAKLAGAVDRVISKEPLPFGSLPALV